MIGREANCREHTNPEREREKTFEGIQKITKNTHHDLTSIFFGRQLRTDAREEFFKRE